MSEYDDLERQLRERVRRRAAGPVAADDRGVRRRGRGSAASGPTGRGPRRRIPRLAVLVAVPVVLAGGVAGAAAIVAGPDVQERAERLANRATDEAFRDRACRFPARTPIPDHGLRIVDGTPRPEALLALPNLAADAPADGRVSDAELRRLLPSFGPDRTVLRSTVRLARFPDGGRVLVFVSVGDGFVLPDAAGCAARRRERLLAIQRAGGRADDDPVTVRALAVLAARRDVDPGAQSLWTVDLRSRATGNGSSGTAVPLDAARPLRPGPLGSGSGRAGTRRTVGLAARGAHVVLVRAAPGSRRARSARLGRQVRRRVLVRQGVYAYSEPRGAGPLVVEHRDAAGHVLLRRRASG